MLDCLIPSPLTWRREPDMDQTAINARKELVEKLIYAAAKWGHDAAREYPGPIVLPRVEWNEKNEPSLVETREERLASP